MKLIMVAVIFALGFLQADLSRAGWADFFSGAEEIIQQVAPQQAVQLPSGLSVDTIQAGLKEALQEGVKKAIAQLGRENGFLGDQLVRIPLPDNMGQIERLLASVGQEKISQQFITSMNRAAEQAVPQVVDIFFDAITRISLADANAILQGPDDAATSYFKEHTAEQLRLLIQPHVKQAMDQAQVNYFFQLLVGQVERYDTLGLLDYYLGSARDIDRYVTDKTMDGLFIKIAAQEKLIRANPAERTSELLREVFGSLVH